jgi:hypothetical protein
MCELHLHLVQIRYYTGQQKSRAELESELLVSQ